MLNADLTKEVTFPLQSLSDLAYLDLPESDWRNYRYKITNETWVIPFVTPARAIHLVIAAASMVYMCM